MKKTTNSIGFILIVVFAIIIILNFFDYKSFNNQEFNVTTAINLLAFFFVVTLIVERIAEVIMEFWREEEKLELEKEYALNNTRLNFDLLYKHKRETQKYCLILNFFIGFLLAISGFNFLHEFIVTSDKEAIVEINEDLDGPFSKLDTSFFALNYYDNIKYTYIETGSNDINGNGKLDTLHFPVEMVNTVVNNFKTFDKEYTALKESNTKNQRLSQKLQSKIFDFLSLIITALVVAGGSDSIHTLIQRIKDFLKVKNENQMPNLPRI